MKVLVINNLLSGYGEGAVYDYIRSIMQDGDRIELRATDGTTPLRELLEDAADFDFVVASGGDGTVAGVAYELAGPMRWRSWPKAGFPWSSTWGR